MEVYTRFLVLLLLLLEDIELVNGEIGKQIGKKIGGKVGEQIGEEIGEMIGAKIGEKIVDKISEIGGLGESLPERKPKGFLLLGDMWLSRDQLQAASSSTETVTTNESEGVTEAFRKWRNGILYYRLDRRLSAWAKRDVRRALRSLQKRLDSCIRFKESSRRDAVHVFAGRSCRAMVGYQGKGRRNWVELANGCMTSVIGKQGKIQHEFMHALGVFHTQSRRDRNEYVTVHKENIKRGMWSQFRNELRIKTSTYNLPYDYRSIMHYGGRYFSKNRKLTIRTKKSRHQKLIGQRTRLSNGDVKLIKKMYGCKKKRH